MKKVILSKDAPAPIGPYSQAIKVGSMLYCSGQIPLNSATNEMLTGDIQQQTELVMKNIGAVLQAGDSSFDHIVKTTIFLTNMADFAKVNEVYAKYFKGNPPARSTVAVAALPRGAQVEIEVIASA